MPDSPIKPPNKRVEELITEMSLKYANNNNKDLFAILIKEIAEIKAINELIINELRKKR